jgi:hypothetical protein
MSDQDSTFRPDMNALSRELGQAPPPMPVSKPEDYAPKRVRDPASTSLAARIAELDPLMERFDKALDRLRLIHDRVAGPRSVPSHEGGKTPTQDSLLASVRSKRDRLTRLLDQLDRELGSLEECL